jgi:hypothetical protein
MRIVSLWNEAPQVVRLTSLLWLFISIVGIILGLYNLMTFLLLPVRGMIGIVIVEIGLQVGVAAIVVLAVWKFLLRAAWSRVVLEIATWITLVYYALIGLMWIVTAIFDWNEFKTSVATELPEVDPLLKLIIGALGYVLIVVISAIVIKALRSSTTRQYVQ